MPGWDGATSAGVIRGFSANRAAIGTLIAPPGSGAARGRAGTDATRSSSSFTKRWPVFGQANSWA